MTAALWELATPALSTVPALGSSLKLYAYQLFTTYLLPVQIMGFLLTLWFFLTPICYPETSLPESALMILRRNPLFALVRAYRAIFLEGHAPVALPEGRRLPALVPVRQLHDAHPFHRG